MIHRLFSFATAALLLASCAMEQEHDAFPGRNGNSFSIECADYQVTDESGCMTKSVIGVDESGPNGSQKVSNWNIWVYDHSTGKICNNGDKNVYDETMKTFFTQTSNISGDLIFPDEKGIYDVYIITNVEKLTPPLTVDKARDYVYTFDGYNSFKPENGGFPMATVYGEFCPDEAVSRKFVVQRLVSRYDIAIVNDIPNSDFTISSVLLKQAARKIFPFQENSKIQSKEDAGMDYDSFASVELEKRSDGTYRGELYMLENNQGEVFVEGVSSDKDRIPENMAASRSKGLCTYLEFIGDIDMKDGHGQKGVTFRHYFGSGRNAGVLRNVNTTVTLALKSCPSGDKDWRVEPDEPYDTRTVEFEPSAVDIQGDGEWNEVAVTPKSGSPLAYNEHVEYKLECPEAGSADLSFDGLTMGQSAQGMNTLKIRSNYSGEAPVVVKVYAYVEGKCVSSMDVRVSAKPVRQGKVYIPIVINCNGLGSGSLVITNVTMSSTTGLSFKSSEQTVTNNGFVVSNAKEGDVITCEFKVNTVSVPSGYRLVHGYTRMVSNVTFTETFKVVYDSELHVDKPLEFILEENLITKYHFAYTSTTPQIGYMITIMDEDCTYVIGDDGYQFYNTTSQVIEGEFDVRLAPERLYCVRVERVFGMNALRVKSYNGSPLGEVSPITTNENQRVVLGPFTGSELGLDNKNPNTLLLSLESY